MTLPDKFISCDWGTSNFRLRLIKTDTLEVLNEHKTDKGVKTLFQEFKAQNRINQDRFFSNYLTQEIERISPSSKKNVVVASGMASSSIGLKELGYSAMPFDAKGKNLFSKHILLNKDLSVVLVSGAKTEKDVMRGEEIQAVGLADFLPIDQEGLLLLPGTHSKHINYDKSTYTDFQTYMTGEMFDIISTQSILASSVEKAPFKEEYKSAFIQGVEAGTKGNLSSSLFSIRAHDMMNNNFLVRAENISESAAKQENYYYLSGLLIGEELSYLKESYKMISVAANGTLGLLYKYALEAIVQDKKQLNFLDEELLERALLIGQKKVLESYE
ncbi:2-dehydro-3-deoxygalactonokinase [Flammeovirga kamogawensis]|uniref:2-dehydro-3-deoxygalactonokinase n=1 Tax=Flammeovirga kamogawensis TaxID=373891 RepID=A0ABX8H3R3_9BACT|nr:2-dehydro-3-deoxygalactonokinase [Flammeovirga kamogawensis]MBB6461957.1 2-dehydro-3-deoxygalactonokinase [Flammeovirga kamogawensis]QWG10436.1 2-dehydro-3-deoxygalactonokinase [Flammeovirga kamogawensis]TRX63946.1 2-dehydro-3-deoxygalactonokinase [Flammeovirga kamogawensis]